MGSGLTSRKKRFNYTLPSYNLSADEIKWRDFCIKKNIRISPRGIYKDPDNWYIQINFGPYKKGEIPHTSPNFFNRQNIWPEYFKTCKFYYDKYTR